MADPKQPETPSMDGSALWKEESFTDRKVGSIRRLLPVKSDGTPDPSRKPLFVGEASLMTPGGALPLSFEIAAADLPGAIAVYGDALEVALQETMDELQELRRRAASQIVIPPAGALPGAMPPAPGSPLSKLKLP